MPSDLICVVLSHFQHKYHVLFHVTCALVMLAVRDFSGKIRHEQRQVYYPTSSIIQYL